MNRVEKLAKWFLSKREPAARGYCEHIDLRHFVLHVTGTRRQLAAGVEAGPFTVVFFDGEPATLRCYIDGKQHLLLQQYQDSESIAKAGENEVITLHWPIHGPS